MADTSEEELLDKVYLYITEKCYADGTSEPGIVKGSLERKPQNLLLSVDGEMYLNKKRKGKVS